MSFSSRASAWFLVVVCLATAAPASAEGTLRIAEQYGIVYLLINVAQDQHFIEKRAKAAGLDVKVESVKLSGGTSINEALLSGSIDVGGAGPGPMLTLWDRTSGRQNVRAIAALGNLPYLLISTDPRVRTIADFGDQDRIALPAVGVSVQARLLQMAGARVFGEAQATKLDRLEVALPHAEAAAAVLKGGSEINAHFSSPPFQEQELAGNPKAHVVASSYGIMGGPSSAALLYTTEKYRRENPLTYRALIDGLADAVVLVRSDPERAADIFLRVNASRADRAQLVAILRSKDVEYTLTPQNTFALADFMFRIGALKHRPTSARDYVFDDPQNAKAS